MPSVSLEHPTPGFPWSPPLNANDYLVRHSTEGPFLYLSEWVMIDDKEVVQKEWEYEVAVAFLKEHTHLFPELDEQGDCLVEGRFREGPIDRTPPPCGTCGGNREIEGFRPGDAPRVDCPECVSPFRRVSKD